VIPEEREDSAIWAAWNVEQAQVRTIRIAINSENLKENMVEKIH
jgi:hypothetical protein